MSLLALPNEILLKIGAYLRQLPNCDCGCHMYHISHHISVFSRSNLRLHHLLSEYLLATASKPHMLYWAITNSCPDTVALALECGANPNTLQRADYHMTSPRIYGTPVELAISMREHSVNAESHAMKLATLALLLEAGGICTIHHLDRPTRWGDLDLLALCLPRVTDSGDRCLWAGLRSMLKIAVHGGQIETAKLAIGAGAKVNSVGKYNHPEFYPPLWACWQAPIASLQVLLDAGADPTWHAPHGGSVAHNMRQKSPPTPELEEKIALLVRYGAVDERTVGDLGRSGGNRQRYPPGTEYHGWVPNGGEEPIDWTLNWVLAGREEDCDWCGSD